MISQEIVISENFQVHIFTSTIFAVNVFAFKFGSLFLGMRTQGVVVRFQLAAQTHREGVGGLNKAIGARGSWQTTEQFSWKTSEVAEKGVEVYPGG